MHKQLTGGLILRSLSEGFVTDQEQLPDLYAAINGEGASEHVKNGIRHWARELMYNHPTVTLADVFVVVDPAKNDLVVSATLLIPQMWRYEDIPIAVGRPELVATIPEYRGRGLVRALFEVVHERSAALGHHMQVITGIGNFYRQFGYTMAVELSYPHAVFSLAALPDRKSDYQPAFTLRPAIVEDIPAISAWNTYFARERLLTEAFSDDVLRYEITGRQWGYYPQTDYQVIVNADGQGVGYIAMLSSMAEPFMTRCIYYVVGDQASYVTSVRDKSFKGRAGEY